MAKALMLMHPASNSAADGDKPTLFGQGTRITIETRAHAECTEGATFTNLRARVYGGNSGTATFTFRLAGLINGNNTFQISGTGDGEDTTHSDVLSDGDTFCVSYADTGTNSDLAWIAANIELASGYGAITGCSSGGVVQDRPSETRYHPLAGELLADGQATRAEVSWKARGYTTFEALQVRVTANARTNDSIFRNGINGSDGSAVITFGSGATGLVVDDLLADAISDGQTIDCSITLDTGVQDLTVSLIAATLKSSNTKQDVFGWTTLARAADATEHFLPIAGAPSSLTLLTEAQARTKPGFAGTASYPRIYLSANTYTANATLTVYRNGVSLGTVTLTAGGGAGWYETTGDIGTFDDDDELSIGIVGGTSGSATIKMWGLTLAPTVAAAGEFIRPQSPNLRGNITSGMTGGFQLLRQHHALRCRRARKFLRAAPRLIDRKSKCLT